MRTNTVKCRLDITLSNLETLWCTRQVGETFFADVPKFSVPVMDVVILDDSPSLTCFIGIADLEVAIGTEKRSSQTVYSAMIGKSFFP